MIAQQSFDGKAKTRQWQGALPASVESIPDLWLPLRQKGVPLTQKKKGEERHTLMFSVLETFSSLMFCLCFFQRGLSARASPKTLRLRDFNLFPVL